MTSTTARAVVREIMEVGIRLDATWRLAVSGPWSCEARKSRQPKAPLNPFYRTSRVALGPYDVALDLRVEQFEDRVADDDAYNEVERVNVRRLVFAESELPPRERARTLSPSGRLMSSHMGRARPERLPFRRRPNSNSTSR